MSPRLPAVLLLLAAGVARAQEPGPTPETPPPKPEAPEESPDLWVDALMTRHWGEGKAKPFFAATLDLGYVYFRPRTTFGYGKPFHTFIGIDANPTLSTNALGGYAGLRLALPFLNWRGGARYTRALYRTYYDPDPEDSYDRIDFDIARNAHASFWTLESELETSFHIGPGDLLALASLSYVTGVPEGKLVFEETLRVMVPPNWVWRFRGGYTFRWGSLKQHSIGAVVDVFDVATRTDGRTVRVGPVIRFALSRRVEVRASMVATIISPDQLGLAGSDFTELGVRYRWATE